MSISEDIERVVAGEKLRQERRDRRRKKVDTFMDWARQIFGEKIPLFIPSVVDTEKHTRQPMVKWTQADRSNLLTIRQVADKYGVHPLTVLEKIKQRCFTATRFGKRWLIDRESLEAYFKAKSN
jgi:excisionase family DNA binding protein